MRISAFVGWLLLPAIANAIPGVWRRQTQSSPDCTCPVSGPVTVTVTQLTIVTTSTTVTSESGTVFSTGPASTSSLIISTTATTTIFTGTTTITQTSTTIVPSDSTTTITQTTTTTTCIATFSRKVKRQNSDPTTAPTITDTVDPRPPLTFTSTISSEVVTCRCTPRPRTTGLPITSSCSCPATSSTVTVSTVSTGTISVIVVEQTPTVVVITPTELYTSTTSFDEISSLLATVEVTQTSSTVTIATIQTAFATSIATVISCPTPTSSSSILTTSPSSTSTTSQSSSNTLVSIGPTASAVGSLQCNATAYYVATLNDIVYLYNIDLATGRTFTFASNVGAGTYTTLNGMGFNTRDNFLYAIATVTAGSTYAVVRVATTGALTEILRFQSTTNPGSVGDFDTGGQFYFSGGGVNWYHVDLLPGSPRYGTIVASGTATLTGYTVLDWSYLYGQGEFMYSLGRTTGTSPHYTVLRWSLSTYTWSVFQDFPGTTAANSLIANWGGNNATIWGLQATSGRITRVRLGGQPEEISTGPTGINGGDGARCVLSS